MNRELIADEHSPNTMSDDQLEARMRDWLAGTWKAVLFIDETTIIGYTLFQERVDEIRVDLPNVYVRQFFIKPEYRRRGIGQATFDQLVSAWFPAGATISLDVLETNPGSQHFWERLGFRTYRTTLRRTPYEEI